MAPVPVSSGLEEWSVFERAHTLVTFSPYVTKVAVSPDVARFLCFLTIIQMTMKTHYQVLIIGGGTAGIMTAAQLKRKRHELQVAIVEPSETHWYQPAWTLVGAGTFDMDKTRRSEQSVMPKGVDWIKDRATEIHPAQNKVALASGRTVTYDFLVLATGLVNDYSLIEGLDHALETGAVCSNYVDPEYTWKSLERFNGGTALFTQPATPIKCGGAPQKAMYLAADYLKEKVLDKKTKILFLTPGTVIFAVKQVAETLTEVINRFGIKLKLFHTPVRIDGDRKLACFKDNTPPNQKKEPGQLPPGARITDDGLLEIPFDFLHLAPPQKAPDFVAKSELANPAGWADVDYHSLQHKKFSNVFALGDVAALPTAKTGAAIRKQAPVVVDNLLKLLDHKAADNTSYDGYSSCPLVTGYGKMVLAEFDYKNEFKPDPLLKLMLIFRSYREHWRLWMLKKYGLPYMYWNKMLKGKM